MPTPSPVTVYLPIVLSGLFRWLKERQMVLDTPNLLHVLSRAHVTQSGFSGFESGLCALLSITEPDAIRLTPMFMEAGLTDLVARPIDPSMISPAEMQDMISALNEHFAEDGFHIEWHTPDAWLLHAPESFQCDVPPSSIYSKTVMAFMPQSKRLRAFMNEAQMILFQHPANELIAQRGVSPINALWPWKLVQKTDQTYQWSAVSGLPLWAEKESQLVDDGRELFVANDVITAIQNEDVLALEKALNTLDKQIGEWLAEDRFDSVILDNGRCFTLMNNHGWAFWKRIKPWSELESVFA